MKKILSLILIFGLFLLLAACGRNTGAVTDKNNSTISSTLEDIISTDSSAQSGTESNASQVAISREEAVEIALNHAQLKKEDVINLTAEYDRDINGDEWDVEFHKDNFEYSYEINAQNGSIVKSEKEID